MSEWREKARELISKNATRIALSARDLLDERVIAEVDKFTDKTLSKVVPEDSLQAARIVTMSLVYEQIAARAFAQTRVLFELVKRCGANDTELEKIKELRRQLRLDEMNRLRDLM